MIKLINQHIRNINKTVPLLSMGYPQLYFSSKNPEQKETKGPNDDDKNNKKKIRFGFKHPLQTLIQQKVQQKFKQNLVHKMFLQKQNQQDNQKQQFENLRKEIEKDPLKFLSQIEKKMKQQPEKNPKYKGMKKEINQKDKKDKQDKQKKQKEEKSENDDKGVKKTSDLVKRIIMIAIFLTLLPLLENNQNLIKQDQRKNIQFVIAQIEKSNQPSSVLVQRVGPSEISLICQVNSTQRFGIKVDEYQLVYFLEKLQKVKNGATQVHFTSHYVQHRSIPKYMSNILILMAVAYGVYKFRKTKFNLGSLDNSLDFLSKKFKAIEPQNIKIHFKDVAGMHEAKFQITQFVQFLKRPEKYIEMGAKVPKGALLTGPPGTGKTLLAKACAGQAGVPFFSVSGSDFVQKYSGLGASRVRTLFDEAQKNAPSIIFIDEIDAIGKKRDGGPFSNEERDNTLNQLLVRMDGFDTKNKVIVMAATNRKDMLDPALLRPGRFDRSVEIGLPSLEERAEILKVHLKKVKYDPQLTQDELATKIARITPGFSGAELANTCNQAAILSAREAIEYVTLQKFQKATERVMAGLQKRNMFTAEQKQMLAFYESGKAVTNWFTQGADPVIKISILPFSKSKAGYSHSIKDETSLNTKQELLARVCCYLAGRSAEQHFKGYVTTNGNKDLERAQKIITMIVTKFGMSDRLKMLAFPDFDYTRKPYSEKIEAIIDEQIAKLTKQCQQKAELIIKSKQKQIQQLKQVLLQKQTLSHNDIKNVLGDRPFGGSENYKEYLKDQQEEQVASRNGPGAGAAVS